MSRSYKKPIVTQGYGGKGRAFAKRDANKAIRRDLDIPDGKSYRKVYNPWNICDFKFRIELGSRWCGMEDWKLKGK